MKGKQYNHLLSASQATKGINLAISNAKSLLNDADLLYNHDRFERATALAIWLSRRVER